MYLPDSIQKTLRDIGKISKNEVVKKEGDLFIAINVLNQSSRILTEEINLIESLTTDIKRDTKIILKG
tara:strand:- start:2897 stop:3100 length:204 start_codon:yes stop_codon:yes gene_type:complete